MTNAAPLRINLWSSPRNVSTALMYSWRQRSDTTVVDEPLYAHYLSVTGRWHPGADEVLASQSSNGPVVVDQVMLGPSPTHVIFFKQMAKHLVGLDEATQHRALSEFENILLIREPLDMLTSLQIQLPDATIDDTGLVELVNIAEWVADTGQTPIVIDSKQLLLDPAGVLTRVCERLHLEFDPAMLVWPAGPKPEDGAWAPHWYDRVRASSGWEPWQPKTAELRSELEPVLVEATKLNQLLLPYAV